MLSLRNLSGKHTNLPITFLYQEINSVAMILTKALNVEQPYATQICKGELRLLVKPHYFFSDDRIGIYATSENQEVPQDMPISKIVGSVRVADCVKVDSDRTMQMIAELISPEYAEQFPKNLIPFPKPIYKNHYIWVLETAYMWEIPEELDFEDKINALWTDIAIEDLYKGDDEEEDGGDEGDSGDEGPLMAVTDFKVDSTAHNI